MTKTPWAILLCKFSDNSSEPFPRTFYENLFTQVGAGTLNMVDFFANVSHGTLDLSESRIFGWYTLNKKRSEYTGSGPNPAGRNALIDWARQAAEANGDSLAGFFGVVVCMNVPTDLFGGGAGAVCDKNSMQPSLLGQEMGHVYGLEHSRADGSTTDYQDPWDVMSTAGPYEASHPTYGFVGPGLNSANMAGRGWLDQTRVWNGGGAGIDTVVQLRPLYRRDLPGFLVARVGQYFIEFRVKEKWDANIPDPAILIHRFEDNRSYLMVGSDGRQDLVKGAKFGAVAQFVTEVDVLDIDASGHTATVRLARSQTPSPVGHCEILRRVIRADTRTLTQLYRRLRNATSQAEKDELNRQIEEVSRELDVLYDEFQFRGCHGLP